jgi:hypothetical protein
MQEDGRQQKEGEDEGQVILEKDNGSHFVLL